MNVIYIGLKYNQDYKLKSKCNVHCITCNVHRNTPTIQEENVKYVRRVFQTLQVGANLATARTN